MLSISRLFAASLIWLFIASQVSAQVLTQNPAAVPKVINSATPVYYNTRYAFFAVHPAATWDINHASERATQALIGIIDKFNQAQGAPKVASFFFIDNLAMINSYFWRDLGPFTSVISEGGEHAIHFKNLQKVFIAGGVFDFCLCRAVRDLVLNSAPFNSAPPSNSEIIFVQDAIYINNAYTSRRWAENSSQTVSLLHLTQNLNDLQLLDYVRDAYFGNRTTGICKVYGDTNFPGARLLDVVNFEIDREGVRVGDLGNSHGPTVKLNFSRLSSVNEQLNNL